MQASSNTLRTRVPRAATAAAIAVCLLGVVLFAATDWYVWLAVPFAALFLGLMLVQWKTAWWILLGGIPVSIQLFFFNDALSTSVPDEPMMAGFLGLVVLLFLARRRVLPEAFWRHSLTFIIALQLLWTVVAVCYSQMPLFSVKFLLAKLWFLAAYFIMPVLVFRRRADFKTAFLVFVIPLTLTAVVIFVRHYFLGFNFRKIEKAIGALYYNHVDYSTVLSMAFPLLCVAWPLTRRMRWWWRALLAATIVFFVPAIYFTYARAAILAVMFAGGIALAIRWRLVQWVMPVFYGLMALGLLAVSRNNKYLDYYPNFERTYMHDTWADHIAATFRGEDMSSAERLYRWIAGVRMSGEHPVVGYGPNSFYYYYKPYAVQSFRTWVSRNEERSTTHNYFLLMLVEQGWPAMILYAVLVAVFFVQAQRTYHRFEGDRFYRAATLGVAMMFAAGFVNNFFSELIETHKVGALFYLSLSLLVVLDGKSRWGKEQDGESRVGDAVL